MNERMQELALQAKLKTELWSHLPNAKHIDRVIVSVKEHPDQWAAAYDAGRLASRNTSRDSAFLASRNAAYDAAYYAAWHSAWDAVSDAACYEVRHLARDAACDTMIALVSYDDAARYLDMPSDKLKVLAALSEHPAAVLLIPAVIAFEKIKEHFGVKE